MTPTSEEPPAPEDAPRWDDFVALHAERVQRAARRVCRDDDEAADVSAEVLAAFHADWPALWARHRPDRGGRFETWLAVVARNAAIDCLRRRHGRDARQADVVALESVPEPAGSAPGPEESEARARTRASWTEILRGLAGDERVLLRLYFLEGRDAEELRIRFGGRTRSQVYNRVHTLTKKLEAAAREAGLGVEDVAVLAAFDWSTLLGEEPRR